MALLSHKILSDIPEDKDTDWLERVLHYQPSLLLYVRDLLEAVTSYIPRVIVDAILKSPTVGPLGLSLEGTLMFADIDGFTPLAERFSQMASEEGAEELTELVNQFLDILIGITTKYGGDLQKFGGDAGMFLFRGPGHAQRAAASAIEVQQAMKSQMREVETSFGRFSLRVATGLGSGRLVGLSLGDQEGQELVPVGAPLAAMGRAQLAAPPDETLLDASTFEAGGDAIEAIPFSKGLYQLTGLRTWPSEYASSVVLHPPQLVNRERLTWMLARLDALTPYLSPGLLERLIAAPSLDRIRMWSEYRQVTIMMLSVVGLTDLMPYWGDAARLQQALDAPNAVFKQVRDTVHRYDGTVNMIGVSPKGPYLMVLFGAPHSHEDDPLRAVLAALELQETFGGELRFGINTGYVFASDVGTARRRVYTVMGDEVNLTARLMSECRLGEIWLGPNTSHHPTVTRRVLGELGPLTKFKGKSESIAPFIVQGLRSGLMSVSTSEIPLVGRDRELTQIAQTLHKVKAGQFHVVLLHGRVGVGKSRFAQEIARQAERLGFAVHMGTVPSYGEHLPFAGWDSVLLSLFELDTLELEARPEALESGMAYHGLATWSALVAPVMGLSVPPSSDVLSLPLNMRDMQRQGILHELWLKAAQEQPRFLFLDNVQWMSSASLELLDALLSLPASVPVIVVVTYRDDRSMTMRWEDNPHVLDFPLEALSETKMQELIRHLFEGISLPASVVDWTVSRSGGLPLFATEAVRALIDSGVLQRSNGSWELAGALQDFSLPDMVYGLIQSRIDQLSPPNRHLLRAAAAVGDEMTLATLVAAYGEESEKAVRRRVPQLAPLDFVSRDLAGEVLVFEQPLVREVAYRGLPHRIQRLIHQRLTEYLDYHRERAAPNWLTLMAYYAFAGQLWEKAVETNLELGHQAAQSFLAEQARQALERVLAAADAGGLVVPDARFEAHHLLGETLTSFGLYEDALHHLYEARQMLPTDPTDPVDIGRLADLHYHEAAVLEAQGDYKQALEVVEQGLRLPNIEHTLEGARLYLMGAGLFRRQKGYDMAKDWANRCIQLAARFQGREAQQIRSRGMYMVALLASLQRLTGPRR